MPNIIHVTIHPCLGNQHRPCDAFPACPSPLILCLPLLSFPFSALVVNGSELFLKKSSRIAHRIANSHGQRPVDCPHLTSRHQDSKRPLVHIARVSCCPSPTTPQSGPLRSFGRVQDGYKITRFSFICFLSSFILDLLLSIPCLPL